MQPYKLHSYQTHLLMAWQQVKNKADQKTPLSQLLGALGASGFFFLVQKRNWAEQTKAQPACQLASSSTQLYLLSQKKTETHRTHLCVNYFFEAEVEAPTE